jgi:hypothetical protein
MARKGWKSEFDAACMLGQSAGVLIAAQNIEPQEAAKKDFFSELNREKRRIALEVFKKLAPSNINVGGQKDNPLNLLIERLHETAKSYGTKTGSGAPAS